MIDPNGFFNKNLLKVSVANKKDVEPLTLIHAKSDGLYPSSDFK